MRTTVILRDELVKEIKRKNKKTSLSSIVNKALEDYIRRKKLKAIYENLGNFEFDLSADEIREINERLYE